MLDYFLRAPARRCLLFLLFLSLASPNPFASNTELVAPTNSRLSPFTGYTRAHWPNLTGVPEESGHFQKLPVDEWHQETFERSMMLVAIYTAATGSDRIEGYPGSITDPFLTGIVRGSDPDDAAYRGPHSNFEIYGTNTAMAILLSPKFFWHPLTPTQKQNVLLQMRGLVDTVAYDCNHWYFHLMGIPILERYGESPDRDYVNRLFERLLNWYRGDGWFIDGGNLAFDYYNLWGFQLYNNALCHFDPEWQNMFGDRVRETSKKFQDSFQYLFGRDGGPIPWGRSLSYRFACISALGYALLNDASALDPGQARRIASGCLKHFWEKECLSRNGLLEPGFHGPNSVVAESYIRRGGPYWAAHGLIPLVLPQDHAFWTETEKPMPADRDGGRLALPGAEMVVKVSPLDGEARLYPLGSSIQHVGEWQRGIKYFQHSYSSYLGWAALGEGGPDIPAGRTGVSFDRVNWHYRSNPEAIHVDPLHGISYYKIELDNPNPDMTEFGKVVTHTLIGTDGEVHVFWHDSARPAFMMIGGYGIGSPESTDFRICRPDRSVIVSGTRHHSLLTVLSSPPGEIEWPSTEQETDDPLLRKLK
jgi:hypothetical protein